ncbi:UDP-N-acetyl-D-glucosamine 6-dehydrogenase [Dyadobacter sp. CECT 9623]|uniref:UDP-N-acetyl-D-glucosamine 6-dehydrogenase n=1 Tax=Dyadobacter linearis TaxID=2823330 RepID=A0ABM8UQP1_9BACT|nr:nucleotide sugar dehydrogenase [Dyadobacter sp. CECT 9623]CAG5069728.1 UDP-N-acetyl-D-glucosamine 6-dehydrogenase [Dyadobacter sp. CECT 9623]
MFPDLQEKIAVIGLGYVGLPLAVAFSDKYDVLGYDINSQRISDLLGFEDTTREISSGELEAAVHLRFSNTESDLESANIYIVTVPTPVDQRKKPNLLPLLNASRTIGKYLRKNDIVIYESTVYPGCTEEDCVPVLEEVSGLKYNVDFFCGYSPERINPGDKVRTFTKIKKVTSGSTPEIANFVDRLYASVITAGTHLAPSIKVAEASKAIENAQRDVNISFINELALIFDRMNIDTTEVLEAAGTKWNFLQYKPGLVGGHCIGVDPYYLAYKAESLGYYPQVILSGRDVNDTMGVFVANKLAKLLAKKGHRLDKGRVLILGITFKENCADMRNTRVVDVYRELRDFGLQVDIYDPWASPELALAEYGITLVPEPKGQYEGVVLTVAHDLFRELDFKSFTFPESVIYDLKSVLPREMVDARL